MPDLLQILIALLIYLFVPLFIISFFLRLIKKAVVISRWHHTFDAVPISAQDFFESIEVDLATKGISKVRGERTTHMQTPFLGSRREYLRIARETYAFEICTAHVGSGCYVSWWFFDRQSVLRRILARVPIIRWFLSKKTFHQIDEEDAFCDMVHKSVLDSVDAMTGTKGSTLSEAERSIISLRTN